MTQSVSLSSSQFGYSYGLNPRLQEGGEGGESAKKEKVVPLPSHAAPTVFSVFLDYLKQTSGVKNMVFKSISYLSEWTFMAMPTLTVAKTLSSSTKDAKNWASLAEVPTKTADVVGAGTEFYKYPGLSHFTAFVNKIGLLIVPVSDVLKVASSKIRPMAETSARTLATVCNSALVFTTTYGTTEELMKIGDQHGTKLPEEDYLKDRVVVARDAQITQSWLKIATLANYFAIGALGLTTIVAPWVNLAFATNGLVFTILGQFQKELVTEPAKKQLL